MRHDRYPRVLLLAAAAAVPTLTLVPPAEAVTARAALPVARAADDKPVELPAMRGRIGPDEDCTGPSPVTAEAEPWTRRALGLSRSWQLSRGAGVPVAVVDTGVGTELPALAGRVEAAGDAGQDCVGHGSFAAGLIAAAPTPGSGVTGVAPQARVLAVRGTDLRGRSTGATVAAGIRSAVDGGARVVYVGQALLDGRAELTAAVAHATERDVLVVAPAAPDTAPVDAVTHRPDTTARPYFPAFVPQVLSVVDHGLDGSRPANAPGAFAPDLSAPGDAVVGGGPKGSGHFIGSGSSLAAAHAAGVAALVRARYPQLSAAEVARRLVAAAYPADTPRLDPYASLTAVLDGRPAKAPRAAEAHMTPHSPRGPRTKALVIAGAAGVLGLLVLGAVAVIPRGRARGWRAAGH
ncbi:S8 family serine peptidase [Streptomyces sp. CA-135486]|uniref:S8 family serine peptidase n=1 Tax=Streptomyces sp. CA-135486 TaxID=3240049 RepID=UPI003D8F3966